MRLGANKPRDSAISPNHRAAVTTGLGKWCWDLNSSPHGWVLVLLTIELPPSPVPDTDTSWIRMAFTEGIKLCKTVFAINKRGRKGRNMCGLGP